MQQSQMVIDEKFADDFIQEYKAFLLYAYQTSVNIEDSVDNDSFEELIKKLSLGRNLYQKEKGLLTSYLDRKHNISPKIIEAIKSLEVDKWIYLRDTTRYSLFIKADETVSYAVLGLTQPIKEIFGCSGLYLETGLVLLGSQYVCDGLISNQVQLGKNYRDQFNDVYKELKQNGCFYKSPIV